MTILQRTVGTVVAVTTVPSRHRWKAEVVSVGFKEGDIVKKGQVLFQLDPRPFQAALNQAIATQKKDEAQLVSAQHDAVRYSALASQGAASQSRLINSSPVPARWQRPLSPTRPMWMRRA